MNPAAVADNLARVRERIASAARRGGRNPEEVTLVAVTKTVAKDAVRAAAAAGVRAFGENRLQEAAAKMADAPADCAWHLVGRLQTNKARPAAGMFSLIHSLDREPLAEVLSRAAVASGRPCRVLVQVNVGGNPGQGGVLQEGIEAFIENAARLPYLEICGLMAIGPNPATPDGTRAAFRRLREAFERLAGRRGPEFGILSMGMSGDFEIAVEEGSTMVRIGTALFGRRDREPAA